MNAMIHHKVEKSSTNLIERSRILFFELRGILPPVGTIDDQDWKVALLHDLIPFTT